MNNRRSIRLKNYDYSANGAYYVTICTQDKLCFFGEIEVKNDDVSNGINQNLVGAGLVSARVTQDTEKPKMVLNDIGKMVDTVLHQTMLMFECVELTKYIIMPNHIHMILLIDNRADTRPAPTTKLGDVISAFKSKSTTEYIYAVKSGLFPPFNKRIWQRNYYEHIVRNYDDIKRICYYIDHNPSTWVEDKYYN